MQNERRQAAEAIAENLFAAERAIDDAIARCVRLTVSIPASTAQIHLSAVVGQEAIASSANAFSALIQARQEIVATHRHLDETCVEMGLRTNVFGNSERRVEPSLSMIEKAA